MVQQICILFSKTVKSKRKKNLLICFCGISKTIKTAKEAEVNHRASEHGKCSTKMFILCKENELKVMMQRCQATSWLQNLDRTTLGKGKVDYWNCVSNTVWKIHSSTEPVILSEKEKQRECTKLMAAKYLSRT